MHELQMVIHKSKHFLNVKRNIRKFSLMQAAHKILPRHWNWTSPLQPLGEYLKSSPFGITKVVPSDGTDHMSRKTHGHRKLLPLRGHCVYDPYNLAISPLELM